MPCAWHIHVVIMFVVRHHLCCSASAALVLVTVPGPFLQHRTVVSKGTSVVYGSIGGFFRLSLSTRQPWRTISEPRVFCATNILHLQSAVCRYQSTYSVQQHNHNRCNPRSRNPDSGCKIASCHCCIAPLRLPYPCSQHVRLPF